MSDTPVLHIDLESRSTVDLKKSGAYVYAEHPTTDIWVACFAIDDSPIGVWFPGQPVPELLREHVLAGHPIYAHNANFERIMWREILGPRYGWPVPELEQFYCTAAMAAAMNLPRDLEGAAQALGLPVQKDAQGRNLMLRMAKPRRPRKGEPRDVVLWWDDEERVQRLTEYCKTDVEVERLIEQRLRHLSQAERQVYLLDARINDRGVLVDIETVHKAAEVVEKALKRLDREMAEATGGAVTGCSQVSRLAEWINWRGIDCTGVGKDQLAALLERDDLPDDVRLALSIRQEAAKSSTSKLNAFMAQRCKDGSAKGQLLYHGAGTGRWAGRGVQLQNLPRPMMRRPELAIPALQSGDDRVVDLLWDRPMQVVSDCIRSMVIARPGKRFICADFSNIEGRGVAWLAGEKKKLRAFKAFDEGTGPDLYLVAASGIYGIPLDKLNKDSPERQIGKVAELACFGADTLVLTDRGAVPIKDVLPSDRLWDGQEWVTHQGVIPKGVRQVVDVDGIAVTPDHLVLVRQSWVSANKLASCESFLSRALETGSGSLPSSGSKKALAAARRASKCFARAAQGLTESTSQTSDGAPVPGALLAPVRLLPALGKDTWRTTTSFLTKITASDFSTASPLASAGASTLPTGGIQTTEVGAFGFTGGETDARTLNTSSLLRGGIIPIWSWIASTLTGTTNPATFDSSREPLTRATNGASAQCRSGSSRSKKKSTTSVPVFDIVNAGPRNRFTIISNSGALIAHNCGYQGGVGAFQAMAKVYGVKVEDEFADEIKTKWRDSNPRIVRYWWDVNAAAFEAVANPGRPFECRDVSFVVKSDVLWCRLPSGRLLSYMNPRIKEVYTPWGEKKPSVTFMAINSRTKKWERRKGYGGLFVENITQAVARDIMVDSMLRAEKEGYAILLTVHDEILAEVPEGFGSVKELEQIMEEPPKWAKGFPIAAEGWEGLRYRK